MTNILESLDKIIGDYENRYGTSPKKIEITSDQSME